MEWMSPASVRQMRMIPERPRERAGDRCVGLCGGGWVGRRPCFAMEAHACCVLIARETFVGRGVLACWERFRICKRGNPAEKHFTPLAGLSFLDFGDLWLLLDPDPRMWNDHEVLSLAFRLPPFPLFHSSRIFSLFLPLLSSPFSSFPPLFFHADGAVAIGWWQIQAEERLVGASSPWPRLPRLQLARMLRSQTLRPIPWTEPLLDANIHSRP
eukprot:3934006-Rhodomonas_salina.1